jgi:type II secretory pathway component GspD/PulD (secretin)
MRTDGFDFKATIQMIRERKNAKLLSSPMLVVGDHSQAAIQVSNVTPIPQIEASSLSGLTSGDNVQNSLNIQWNMVRDGVLMWVSPEITENGNSVRLTVHPQVVTRGNKVDLSTIETANNKFKEYPVYNYELSMDEMDTRATVPSGETLMFGGLVKNRDEAREEKVRWLGDIPVIGWLFRSTTTVTVQDNLLIMIRPTILEDEVQTGFETNALKEAKSVMVNSGRDLKKTPIGGPYSVKEIEKKVKDLYEERVVKPFKDEEKPAEKKPEAKPADEAAPAKDGDKKDEKPSEVK